MSRVFFPLLIMTALAAGQATAAEAGRSTVRDVFDAPNASRRTSADFDLNTEAGARGALAWIANEAGRLCSHDGLPSWSFSRKDDCREEAIATAVRNLSAPMVTRLYAQSSPARAERMAAVSRPGAR